jgi:hypothetical protein
MKEVAHHEHRQYETGDQQWDTEDEADSRALTQRQTDDKTRDEKNQTYGNAEGETVGAVKRTA